MDIASIIGIGLSFLLLFIAMTVDFVNFTINVGGLVYFVDIPSLLIVLGGTCASTMTSFPMDQFVKFPKLIGQAFKQPNIQLVETLTLIIDVSKIARKNILAIEDALPSIDNLYLRGGLRMVVDRVDRELIVEMMVHEMKYGEQQTEGEIAVIKTMSSLCPAWGMLGTLVGLVILLQNLDDPSSIGPAMAVALITTFYGSLFANAIFTPVATKLTGINADSRLLHEMIKDGVLYIEGGQRPDFIEQDLLNYLPAESKAVYEQLKFSGDKG